MFESVIQKSSGIISNPLNIKNNNTINFFSGKLN